MRAGEDGEPISMENMPRPHRRRREKKLMTLDEVNERFPVTKYKTWISSRAEEGLPTAGGVTAPASRPGSVRDEDGVLPSSPTTTKHSIDGQPADAVTTKEADEITVASTRESTDKKTSETVTDKGTGLATLAEVTTVETHDPKDTEEPAVAEDEDDDDDHIHTAVPPELLSSPGDSCAICIDTLEGDDDIRGLTCGHAFHAPCLDPWLISRRACCPLCKADYYTPKPRAEGEADAAERTGRRTAAGNGGRINMPGAPQSAWTGSRGPRIIMPGRFMSSASYPNDGYGFARPDRRRQQRMARMAGQQQERSAAVDGAEANAAAAAPRSWRPRITNPFSGRFAGRSNDATTSNDEVTPAQLEAGTVR